MVLNHIGKVPLPCKMTYLQVPRIRIGTFGAGDGRVTLFCPPQTYPNTRKPPLWLVNSLLILRWTVTRTYRVKTKNMLNKQLVMANEPKKINEHLCLFWRFPLEKDWLFVGLHANTLAGLHILPMNLIYSLTNVFLWTRPEVVLP